jgi:hypothetical protein
LLAGGFLRLCAFARHFRSYPGQLEAASLIHEHAEFVYAFAIPRTEEVVIMGCSIGGDITLTIQRIGGAR